MWKQSQSLPHHLNMCGSSHCVNVAWQDGENLILRQSGALASGERQHIYAADMRREVSLQFYPDGFEWLDRDPVPLSLGYSSHSVRTSSFLTVQLRRDSIRYERRVHCWSTRVEADPQLKEKGSDFYRHPEHSTLYVCVTFRAKGRIRHAACPEHVLMMVVHMQAGVDGQQNLPDSFQVARATGSEAPQSVYINRELDLDVWQLADKVSKPVTICLSLQGTPDHSVM